MVVANKHKDRPARQKKKTAASAQAEIQPEEKPVSFLEEVAKMATLAEEAIYQLRCETHHDRFQFRDLQLSHLFPQKIDPPEYLGQLKAVVNEYLQQTRPYGLGEWDFRAGSPLEENTSRFGFAVHAWKSQVYTARKAGIDKMVDEAFQRIVRSAEGELADMIFNVGMSSQNQDNFFAQAHKIKLCAPEQLEGEKRTMKTILYMAELPRPEFLDKLYEMCFKAEVKQRGWDELDDETLAEALEKENVPLEDFAWHTGKNLISKKMNVAPTETVSSSKTISKVYPLLELSKIYSRKDKWNEPSSYGSALTSLNQSLASAKRWGEVFPLPTTEINGREYVRLPTIKEILQSIVINFNTNRSHDGKNRDRNERIELLEYGYPTCSALLNNIERFGSDNLSMIPRYEALSAYSFERERNDRGYVKVPKFMPPYGRFERDIFSIPLDGINFDSNLEIDNPIWLAAVDGDGDLLREVLRIQEIYCLEKKKCNKDRQTPDKFMKQKLYMLLESWRGPWDIHRVQFPNSNNALYPLMLNPYSLTLNAFPYLDR